MDSIDLKLITLLQKNARTPLKILANQVFLSSPATAARIEKLEKEGIIGSYTANVDLKKAGFPIIAFIQLDLDPKLECNCITGCYSQLIKVAFETTEALDAFIGELNSFGHTETQIAFSTPQPPRGIGLETIKLQKKQN